MGKNVYTEIKCHSLLPLDEIVHIATHPDCIPEIKIAYINFLNHCYVDTEVRVGVTVKPDLPAPDLPALPIYRTPIYRTPIYRSSVNRGSTILVPIFTLTLMQMVSFTDRFALGQRSPKF